MFSVGEVVFYPVFGAGLIINIENKNIYGIVSKFYIVKFIKNQITIMVPVENADKKLRKGITKEEVEKVYNVLKEKSNGLPGKWLDRYKIYASAIKLGDIFKLTEVLREIYFLSTSKKLSKSEENYFIEIIELISSEISLVSKVAVQEVKGKIIGLLKGDN